MRVGVASAASPTGAELALQVWARDGGVLLARRYRLAPPDCARAGDLVALALERRLTDLSTERWSEPARRGLEVALLPAIGAADLRGGGDVELGLRLDRGNGRVRLGGAALVRQVRAGELGGGVVGATAVLGGAGVRIVAGDLQATVELRGGLLRVFGDGFVEDRASVLGWVEGAGSLSWVGRSLGVSLIASASPVGHLLVATEPMEMMRFPRFRIGVGLIVPLSRNDP